MLTYTFSTREKILIALFSIAAIAVLWYRFVFLNIQDQITAIDGEIAAAQDQLLMYQTEAASLDAMRALVEEYQAQGVQPVVLPSFDNTQNLMAYLNSVLSTTAGYSMSFDNPTLSDSDGVIHRSGTISFSSGSYADARQVIQLIARGPYPSQVTALGITDNSSRSSGSGAVVSANVQVTFFEQPTSTSDVEVEEDDGIPEGNDWSKVRELYN